MSAASDNLTGTWHSKYWYNNTKHDGREDTSEHDISIERNGDKYVFHSLADHGEASGSQLEGRFTVDGQVLFGNAIENTSPTGEWGGKAYNFSFQAMIDPDGTRMAGRWVAAIYNNGNPVIGGGRWEFTRIA